jgi:hypothetical protein
MYVFSPFGMNISPRVRQVLAGKLPPDEAILTGGEFVETVLEPLSRLPEFEEKFIAVIASYPLRGGSWQNGIA